MESTYVVTGQTTVGVVRHDDDPIMVRKCLGRHIFFVHNTLQRRFTNKGGGYDDDEGKVTYIYGEEEERQTV